jgi:hypothetical protein
MFRRSVLLGGLLLCVTTLQAQHAAEVTDALVPLTKASTTSAGKATTHTLTSASLSLPFNGVMVELYTPDAATEGWIRFEDTDTWQPLRLFSFGENTLRAAIWRGAMRAAPTRFEVQFRHAAGADFHVAAAGVFITSQEESPPLAVVPIQPSLRTPALPAPRLVRRSEWGARPFNCGTPDAQPFYTYLTLHHTAGIKAANLEEGKRVVKDIQTFHIDGRGWCDIGYQFLMDSQGNLYQGRPFMNEAVPLAQVPQLVIGAHVANGNTGNVGLSVLGCYHPPEGTSCRDVASAALVDSIQAAFAYLADAYNVKADNLRGHRDFNSTSCPGDNNYSLLPALRTALNSLLSQPVAFAQVSATLSGRDAVTLTWQSTLERNVAVYHILRSAGGAFETVGEVPAAGQAHTYQFTDALQTCEARLTYRIDAVTTDGQAVASPETSVERPALAVGTLEALPMRNGIVGLRATLTEAAPGITYRLTRTMRASSETLFEGTSLPTDLFRDLTAPGRDTTRYALLAVDAAGCTALVAEALFTVEQPTAYTLAPGFPNPFNPSTTLRYYLEVEGPVRLQIYDVQGRLVRTLVDGVQAEAQWHRVVFDATGLSSGVYYAVLEATRADGSPLRDLQTLVLSK